MAKVILEFDLPEEKSSFEAAMQGQGARIVLQELDNKLRALIKYAEQDTVGVVEVREWITELCSDYEVKLYE
jgi:hypothetical protein